MIEIENLRKEYRRGAETVVACSVRALHIERGEQVALIGRSGCGKTTLLNMIAGIVRPSRGALRVAGTDLARLGEGRRDRFRGRHIGMVFQTFNLLQPFSALENVLLGAQFAGHDRAAARDRAHDLLQRVGLGERLHHRPNELSVGQMQRVAICRALINDPELILADEPLGNQDQATGGEVLQMLLGIAREEERTVVMVTHDLDSAALMQRTLDLEHLKEVA
ncbi:MAG: ABC transporter ATP-binding protein [Planctomycetes bacterium]|nr:ABC transporter ATP-binding protein [Planctomycetota bacterium]